MWRLSALSIDAGKALLAGYDTGRFALQCVNAGARTDPCQKHERALRAVLRWLKHIKGYRQVVSSGEEKDLILRCYVNASWSRKKSVDRKSINRVLGPFCLKAWTRLQQADALVEGAK